MTPEEKAVIEAAAEWSRSAYPGSGATFNHLALTVEALVKTQEPKAEEVPEWVPATFLYCLAGDRIRIGTDESDVLRSSSGAWHANVVSSVLPSGRVWDKVTPWEHRELKLDLSANPGFREYSQDTPCEIWMSAERRAVHVLMSAFPGSAVLDSPQAEK